MVEQELFLSNTSLEDQAVLLQQMADWSDGSQAKELRIAAAKMEIITGQAFYGEMYLIPDGLPKVDTSWRRVDYDYVGEPGVRGLIINQSAFGDPMAIH